MPVAVGFSVFFGAWIRGQGKAKMRSSVIRMASIYNTVMRPETHGPGDGNAGYEHYNLPDDMGFLFVLKAWQ